MLLNGDHLDRYEILDLIASGGMGSVYRAWDMRLERNVAVKTILAKYAADGDALQRFEREAKALAAVPHPNILTIFDVGEVDGLNYAVVELLEGETLERRISRGPLATNEAFAVAIAVADGLAAAHERGLVHRDLKPANVFLTSSGGVKILDFGIARLAAGAARKAKSAPLPEITDTDVRHVIGTPAYMSPEQALGRPDIDGRSDVFSFGSMLYEMLTGLRAFPQPTVDDVLLCVIAAVYSTVPAGFFSQELAAVIEKCLRRERDERYGSGAELAAALRGALNATQPTLVPRPSEPLPTGRPFDSIAVLPFENAAGDAESEYLCDGVTESLIYTLSKLSDLRVMARATVFRFKGAAPDPVEVGRQLGVRAVLSGRLARAGGTLKIGAELVAAVDGSQLWGERYSRPTDHLIDVEEDIARHIVDQLHILLFDVERERLARPTTEDSRAYQLYLRGRHRLAIRSGKAINEAVDLFNQAVEADPSFALAYAGIADCYALLSSYGLLKPKLAFGQAREAATRALKLDDTLAEAHTALGVVKVWHDWKWDEGEYEYARALDLNPSYAAARQWRAELRMALGRFGEASEEIERARTIDPLSRLIAAWRGLPFLYARRHDRAIELFAEALEMDPEFYPAHLNLGRAYAAAGRIEDAIASFRTAAGLDDAPWAKALLAYALGRAGEHASARAILDGLRAVKVRDVSPYAIATIHLGLGEVDAMFDALGEALERRSEGLLWLKVEPRFDPVRDDPRFRKLLGAVNLS